MTDFEVFQQALAALAAGEKEVASVLVLNHLFSLRDSGLNIDTVERGAQQSLPMYVLRTPAIDIVLHAICERERQFVNHASKEYNRARHAGNPPLLAREMVVNHFFDLNPSNLYVTHVHLDDRTVPPHINIKSRDKSVDICLYLRGITI